MASVKMRIVLDHKALEALLELSECVELLCDSMPDWMIEKKEYKERTEKAIQNLLGFIEARQ